MTDHVLRNLTAEDETSAEPRSAERRSVLGYRDWSWVAFFAVAGAMALGGGFLLLLAIDRSDALAGLAGAVIATIGGWGTTEYTAARWKESADAVAGSPWYARVLTPWRMTIVMAAGLAFALFVFAERTRSPVVAFLGLMLLAIGSGPIVHAIHSGSPRRPGRWVLAGMIVALAGATWLGTPLTDDVPFRLLVGIVVTALGLLALGRGLSTYAQAGRFGWIVGAVAVASVVVGTLLDAGFVIAVGAIGCVASLMALAADAEDDTTRDGTRPTDVAIPAVGGLLVLVAGWFVWVSAVAGESVLFLLFLVAAIAMAGANIVWRTELVFGAVVVGFVFVWGITASTVSDADGVSDNRDATALPGIVALGDSFISGEGASEFYEGTDEKGDLRNECRRAPTAYPVLVSVDDDGVARGGASLGTIDGLDQPGIEFLACSGAETHNVVEPGVAPTEEQIEDRLDGLSCTPPSERVFASYPCGRPEVYGWGRQLDDVPGDLSRTQLVLLSIGGNDARFGEVVMGCLVPGTCAERREVWLDQLTALGLELEATYDDVREAFNPDGTNTIPIVVMPYPLVVTEERCGRSPFEVSEHEFVVEFTTALNEQIEAAAARAGVHFFKPGMFAFEDHRVCEEEEQAINLIELQPSDGPVLSRLHPGSWTHNSMHPNEVGHRLIAEALTAWLNDHGIVGSDGPANPPTDDELDAQDELAELDGAESADAVDAPTLFDLQAPRTFAIDPTTVQALRSNPPEGSSCNFDPIETFAARVEVFDEDTDGPAPKVQLRGADPAAVICYTASDGSWRTARPDRTPEDDESTPQEGIAEVSVESDGEVFIRGGRPNDTCVEPLEGSQVCRHQWVLFSSAPGDPDVLDAESVAAREQARVWQLRVIDFCTVDPDCPDSVGAWSDEQLGRAALILVPAAVIIAFGGWLLALGLLLNRRFLERFVPPFLRPDEP